MKLSTILSLIFSVSVSLVIFASAADAFQPTTHVITFGSNHQYSPSNITVEVGDTIIWQGDFSQFPMVDSSNIPGVAPIPTQTSGMSFTYIIQAAGTYRTENTTWAFSGMICTIVAVFKPHGSLTNEGREFYLGMIYPTYNNIVPSSVSQNFSIFALITTFYADTFYVSFYDASGTELQPTRYVLGAHQFQQIDLTPNLASLRLDGSPETAASKACHITSKNPIAVQYLSRGPNSGGSYLALPVLSLGKNYVVASYGDNGSPNSGALIGSNPLPSASTVDNGVGSVVVIATEDVTSVNIKLASGTSTGSHSRGQSTNFSLQKGQCYLIRSDGKDASHDLTGSVIQATKPIVVLSGHEDAFIGDLCSNTSEGRNSMIEQLIPVEYWDTNGYIGVPFIEGGGGTCLNGKGDTYRALIFDASASVQADISGVPGGYSLNSSQLNYGEKSDIAAPADIYSTNGHKISVTQYDERTTPAKGPFPAPSMLTIIPHSRWRKSYNFAEYNPPGATSTNPNQYVNILSDSITQIKVSVSGAAEGPLSSGLVAQHSYNTQISSSFSHVRGGQYLVSSTGNSYYLHSEYPFICYMYGMTEFPFTVVSGHTFAQANYETEYSTPAGVELNTGVPPSFKVSYSDIADCGGWNISITDNGTNSPGIKAVILIDDSAGVYYDRPGVKYRNVSFDATSPDYTTLSPKLTNGELHPNWQSNQPYTFSVLRNSKLAASDAPLAIIDNNGNGYLLLLHKDAPTISLATVPASADADSIYFPTQTVGTQICSTFVITNTAAVGGSPMSFLGVKLANKDTATFKIGATTPALPASIPAQGTLTVSLCSKLSDTKHHVDSLVISNDCFDVKVSLDARGATGVITADDINFGNLDTGKQITKTLTVHNNLGTADFKLLPSSTLSDNMNYSIDPLFLAKLPLTVKAGTSTAPISVIFHPKQVGNDSTNITWVTDIDPSFEGTGRSYSKLLGSGLAVINGAVNGSRVQDNLFSVRPNPAKGNAAVVSFSLPSKNSAAITIYDLLGRELFTQTYVQGSGEFEIPIGNLQQGIYYVRLTSGDVVLTQKLEVQR